SGDGPFHQVLTDVLNQRGNAFSVLQTFTRALFRPRENGDAYLQAALSGDYRKKLRRWKRRLSEMGKLDFVALEDGDDPAAWAEKFLQVEASGWKGKAGTALASNEADREFFVQSVATAHRRGRLDLTFLRLDGRTLAAKCCFLAPPGAFAFKIAFNEDYAKCAP